MHLLFFLVACAPKSGLTITPQNAVVLGESPHRAFRASVQNTGPVPVRIRARSGSTVQGLGALEPGAQAEIAFDSDQAAVFINESTEHAELRVKVKGDRKLSVAFEPLEAEPVVMP